MKFLGNYQEEFIAKLMGDYTKIIIAAFFAGEFFLKLSSLERIIFWLVFIILLMISILFHPKNRR